MSKRPKKVCITLNYIEHFLILASAVTGCISISAFVSLAVLPKVNSSHPVGLKICEIATGIKNFKSIVTKKKKKHDKIVLLEKTKLNTIYHKSLNF